MGRWSGRERYSMSKVKNGACEEVPHIQGQKWGLWKDAPCPNSGAGQRDRNLKDEFPRSVGAQNAPGDQGRNNSRKNEEMEQKQKQQPVVDVTGNGSKVWCCKEQYCIGTWNVRSMNQSKLEVVKQEMARVNVDILGISKLKWTGMGELNLMTIITAAVGKNP